MYVIIKFSFFPIISVYLLENLVSKKKIRLLCGVIFHLKINFINYFNLLKSNFFFLTDKNVTLPEDQDIQGFLPLGAAIPEFRYYFFYS